MILGAELTHHYKPDPQVCQTAVDLLGPENAEVMMVAARLGDLGAAKRVGLRTGLVPRPKEHGPNGTPDLQPNASVDLAAKDSWTSA